MLSTLAAASWRSTAVLLFACCCCHMAILADAFAHLLPPNPRRVVTNNSNPSNRVFDVSSDVFGPIQKRIMTKQHQSNNGNDTEEGIEVSTDGVPSSPLDRPVLSAIDAISLLVFAGIGKASHSAVDGSLDLIAVGVTAFPFLVSWFLIAPLVGSYTPEATRDVKSAVIQTSKAWVLAVPLGCILRGVIKGYVPPVPFVVVTLIATLVILGMGRVGYTVLSELYVEMF